MAAITRSGAFIPSSAARYGQGVLGGSCNDGDPVYADAASAGALKQADANAVATGTVVGLLQHGGVTGQSVNYVIEDPNCQIGATLVVGQTLWSSATAGGITVTAADNVTGGTISVSVLGVANSTTTAAIKIINASAFTP